MKRFFYILPIVLLFCSCRGGQGMLPNPAGAAGEMLIVIDECYWRSDGGKALFDIVTSDVPCLPQAEPMFTPSHVEHAKFDRLLRPARNIILVEIDSTRYTRGTIKLERNRWSRTQAVATITAGDVAQFQQVIERNSEKLLDFFVRAERERQIDYLAHNLNSEGLKKAYDKFGIKLTVPSSLNKYNEADDFLWMSNGSGTARLDLVIYSYPYTSKQQLTREALIAKRDSVLCAHIPGSFEGSCMGTATAYEPPVYSEIFVDDAYCAELRGLWEMKNGETMGGPFISHTRLDELHNRLITIEGFVFAPGKEKRNYLRQMEAVVYSTHMPQDVEALVVTPKK